MSPEEAYAVHSRIVALTWLGEDIKREEGSEPREKSAGDARQLRLSGWLGEVEGLVKKYFAHNPALVGRAEALANTKSAPAEGGTEPFPPEPALSNAERVDAAINLLRALDGFVFVEPLSGATDGLKVVVEQTLRETYFSNWPFRLVMGALALLVTLFFGGTVYLGYQVQGIANQADAARKSIDQARENVMTATAQTVTRVEEQARNDANAELAKLRDLIAGFKDKAADLQKDAQSQEAELRNNATESNKTIAALRTDLAARPGQVDDLFEKEKQKIQDAVSKAVNSAPTVTNAYVEAKKTDIDRVIGESVKQRVDGAQAQIEQQTKIVAGLAQGFEHEVEISRRDLPQAAKLANDRAAEFTTALNRYSGNIDDIFGRLSGGNQLNMIDVVARVLGAAFWVAVGSLLVSFLALARAFFPRRPRVRSAAITAS